MKKSQKKLNKFIDIKANYKYIFKKISIGTLIILIVGSIIIFIINIYVLSFSNNLIISDINEIENTKIGLVFGAKVLKNGNPSDILKDRLIVAIEAYKNKKIEKIIVSGDNSRVDYDEPTSMRDYLIKNGVAQDDIYLDYAGFDTLDSLYRAKEIFGVEKMVLFTQEFHLKRALYIANKLGISSIGVQTNLQKYIYDDYYNRREILARLKAFLNIEIFKSKPQYLGKKVDMSKPQEELSNY